MAHCYNPNHSLPGQVDHHDTTLTYRRITSENTADPSVWGSAFWFSLHNGAKHYPATPTASEVIRMKGFIRGLSVILPCGVCKYHADLFVQQHETQIDDICSSKDSLFDFFVDFHNAVNERNGKPKMSYTDARKLYENTFEVVKLE